MASRVLQDHQIEGALQDIRLVFGHLTLLWVV